MARWKCNACGGSYSDANPDGTVYMHSCGPIGTDKTGATVERPNRRSENVVIIRDQPSTEIIAHGDGVTALDGQKDPEPVWITKLRAPVQP